MSIESALKTHLENDATLSGLGVVVYPHVAPQQAVYPFITYSILSAESSRALNKAAGQVTLTETTIELQVFSDSVSERSTAMTRIRNILHGFRGALGTENLDIRETTLQNVSTFSEADITGTDEQIYRANLVFSFFYNWT